MDILTYIAQTEFNYPEILLIGTGILTLPALIKCLLDLCGVDAKMSPACSGEHGGTSFIPWNAVIIVEFLFMIFRSSLA